MGARFRKEWDEEIITLAADQMAGDVIQTAGGKAALIMGLNGESFVTGNQVHGKTAGQIDVDSASGTTFSAGDNVAYDSASGLAVTAPGDFLVGKATVAKVSGELHVRVALNDQGATT